MSTVVVWLTSDGIVEHVADSGVDVLVVDFQNLDAGDPPPELSEAHKALLRQEAPSVLDDLAKYRVHYCCGNCRAGFRDLYELTPVKDLEQRVESGEPMPVGECPHCGAVVHPVVQDWWPVPQSALDRHGLTGIHNVAPEAVSKVCEVGLDRVLAWLKNMAGSGMHVGDIHPIGEFGLEACYGVVLDKPDGLCCHVNICVAS